MTHKVKLGGQLHLEQHFTFTFAKPTVVLVYEVLFTVFRTVLLIRIQSDRDCLGRTDLELDLTFLTRKTSRSVNGNFITKSD
jgi:hypothetical protein